MRFLLVRGTFSTVAVYRFKIAFDDCPIVRRQCGSVQLVCMPIGVPVQQREYELDGTVINAGSVCNEPFNNEILCPHLARATPIVDGQSGEERLLKKLVDALYALRTAAGVTTLPGLKPR